MLRSHHTGCQQRPSLRNRGHYGGEIATPPRFSVGDARRSGQPGDGIAIIRQRDDQQRPRSVDLTLDPLQRLKPDKHSVGRPDGGIQHLDVDGVPRTARLVRFGCRVRLIAPHEHMFVPSRREVKWFLGISGSSAVCDRYPPIIRPALTGPPTPPIELATIRRLRHKLAAWRSKRGTSAS